MWEYIEPGWDSDASPEVGFIALAGVLIPDAFTTAVGQTVGKPADR